MRRRDVIGLISATAVSWPMAARAQRSERVSRIGVLMGGTEGDTQTEAGLAAFRKELQALGWIEGRNIQVDIRWGMADIGRMQAAAKELISLRPDVLVAHTTPVTAALKQEAGTIPIVFLIVSDPIGSGFIQSLSRPGGNITGFINIESSLSGKWIEILLEVVPRLSRAALVFNPDTAPYFAYYLQPFEAAARSRSIEPLALHVRTAADIERTVASLGERPDTGLAVMPDIFTATRSNLELIISLAARHRLPAVYPYRYMVAAGGLMSYGVDNVDIWRRAPTYVDRILKGAKPADLPVQLPTKFELAVNLKTAAALGIEIPAMLLGRADEVVE